MRELVAAVLVATCGAVDPREVLLMRLDYCLWLVEGYTALHQRGREGAADVDPVETVDASGRRRRRITSIEDLKGFLRQRIS